MAIGLGCDHWGLDLKCALQRFLTLQGRELLDFGVHSHEPCDYPDIAFSVARAVQDGQISEGILICRTGIGMAIAANKVPGIRAACVSDTVSALAAKQSNHVQVLTLGAQIVTPSLAVQIVETWLSAEFRGGDSERKLIKIGLQEGVATLR